jgi:hypothetical protein
MRLVFAGLGALAACSALPQVELPSSVILPLEAHLVPVVHACGGDERFDVVLDTGAARTLLDAGEARRMDLSVAWRPWPRILVNDTDWDVTWHSAALERLELGALRIDGLRAPLLDLRAMFDPPGAIAGLVGEDVLRSLVLVIDGDRREVELVPADERARTLERRWPGRDWRAHELRYERGCPVLELELASGVTARLVVDTGAEVSSFPGDALRHLEARTVGSLTVSGRIGGKRGSGLHVVDALPIGGWEVALAVSDASSSKGLLAMDVLELLPIALDGPGAVLWIGAPLPDEEKRLESAWFGLSQLGSDSGS